MAEIVNEILEKFAEISREEKQIALDMENALKEYTDYCKSSDTDLTEKIQEIRNKMSKLQFYIDYAREHAQASDLEDAATAFETSEGALESIRQTIKLDSHNDMNAETLYTKATGQKLFYEEKIEQTKKLVEGSKVQAKRQYDSDVAAINERKAAHDATVKGFVQSDEFKNYLKTLMFDKSAFNSTGTANLPDKSFISLGQRRVKLTVPIEIEQDLSLASNGEYNSAAHTIGAPLRLSVQKGNILYLDYDERNRQYLFGGIQRLLLNVIKYIGHNITDCLLCEPVTNSPDCLGHIAILGKGINPFVVVPQTVDEIDSRVKDFCAKAQAAPTPDMVSRVLVMHGFPEKYDADIVDCCTALFKKAAECGVLVVLTHDNSVPATPQEQEIREISLVIRSRNGGFWVEKLRESFFWYSAPSDIPEDIRREYVDRRRQMATQQAAAAVQTPVQPAVDNTVHTAPAAVESVPKAAPVDAPVNPPVSHEESQPVESEPEIEKADDVPAEHQEHEQEAEAENPAKQEDLPADDNTPDLPVEQEDNAESGSDSADVAWGQVVLGYNTENRTVCLDINGNVSYICGKRSRARLQITGDVISSVIASSHPDDAELWIFDFGGGELMRYAENSAAHIRFLVSDGSAEAALDAIDSIERELEYRDNLFIEKGWKDYSALPSDEYLPKIVVVVNGFPIVLDRIGKSRLFGRDYTEKLNGILKYCDNYGVHFVLVGETFTEDGKRPACFKNCSIHSAAAIASCGGNIAEMFKDFSLRDGELASVRRIPSESVFVASQGHGGCLVRLESEAAGDLRSYTAISEYNTDADTYVEKYPLIINRKDMPLYEERHDERSQLIAERESGDTLLFFGEPCRLEAEYPVHVYNDFGENVLALVPAREKNKGLGVVFAVISSLCEQDIPVEIIAFRSNPVYAEMTRIGAAQGIQVFEGDTAIGRIKEIVSDIAEGRQPGAFEIVLGADTLLAAMGADNAVDSLINALAKGPMMGLHFMFVASNLGLFDDKLYSLFKHKAVFPCSAIEAEKVLRDPCVEIPDNAFRLSSEGDEITVMPYII